MSRRSGCSSRRVGESPRSVAQRFGSVFDLRRFGTVRVAWLRRNLGAAGRPRFGLWLLAPVGIVVAVVGSANARHHVGGWSYLLFFASLFLATFLACLFHIRQADIARPMH